MLKTHNFITINCKTETKWFERLGIESQGHQKRSVKIQQGPSVLQFNESKEVPKIQEVWKFQDICKVQKVWDDISMSIFNMVTTCCLNFSMGNWLQEPGLLQMVQRTKNFSVSNKLLSSTRVSTLLVCSAHACSSCLLAAQAGVGHHGSRNVLKFDWEFSGQNLPILIETVLTRPGPWLVYFF